MIFEYEIDESEISPVVGEKAVLKLLEEVDRYIPEPIRDLDKPFHFPIEHIYSITGELNHCAQVVKSEHTTKPRDYL